ncbi:MAG TPA: response regulator [Candidatus Acidoferrum sp.]|jgi:sigma-B regulation protein RsbU (phosphoserine phosphatase)|nr:response regulator [Candidatus Acidoferrum sp.]
MNILIVDDDAVCRMALGAALKKLGHQVTAAKDGVDALAAFQQQRNRVVISDLLMPGMDGLELCRRIRSADAPRYTYFILLTIMEGKANYLEGMKAGADDFLTKPFDTEMLVARLAVAERVLNLQSELRQLAGLLPICSLCKKVRDDQNYWHQVESYITEHTEAQFTHSYCPDCFRKILSEVEAMEPSGS